MIFVVIYMAAPHWLQYLMNQNHLWINNGSEQTNYKNMLKAMELEDNKGFHNKS